MRQKIGGACVGWVGNVAEAFSGHSGRLQKNRATIRILAYAVGLCNLSEPRNPFCRTVLSSVGPSHVGHVIKRGEVLGIIGHP